MEPSTEHLVRVCKQINIEGNFAVSLFSVSATTVDLGRIGFENDWMDIDFTIDIQNLWDTHTKISIICPEQVQLEKSHVIGPLSVLKLKGTLSTSLLKSHSGYYFADVVLQNLSNPLNKHKVTVKADITHPSIK
jgi:hypothetical protein